MMRGTLAVALLLLFALLSFTSAMPGGIAAQDPPTSPPWTAECIDCPHGFSFTSDRALRLDGAGHPHVAYGGDYLYYARHDGAAWQVEVVDTTPGSGALASLALDAAGRPHVVYLQAMYSGTAVKYARWDGAQWQIETVEEASYISPLSLALDATGHLHVAYFAYYAEYAALRHAWHDGAAWHLEAIEPSVSLAPDRSPSFDPTGEGRTGAVDSNTQWYETRSCSLALDSAGHPHVAYNVYSDNNELEWRYARYDGAAWQHDVVYGAALVYPAGISLALDPSDRPHLLFSIRDDLGDDAPLVYASHDGTRWVTEEVASGIMTDPSLALDAAGEPRVAFTEEDWQLGASELRYGRRSGGVWTVEPVAGAAAASGLVPSLALDAAGLPHVTYLEFVGTAVHLKYAHHDGAGWRTEYVDSGGAPGGDPSLAIDATGAPHVAYEDSAQNILMYSVLEGGSWSTVQVAPEDEVRDHVSLALDGAGRPHIAYSAYISRESGIKYAWHDGVAWQVETVRHGGAETWGVSLAAGPGGAAYIAYGDSAGGGETLVLASRDGGMWVTETVQTELAYGFEPALALDAAGGRHLAYVESGTPNTLKYAWHDGSGWHTEAVDSGTSGSPQLAIDAAGRPHLVYARPGDLRYAVRDGGGWGGETLPFRFHEPSFALDALGQPHISAADGWALWYVWRGAGTWRAEPLGAAPAAPDWQIAQHSSLAVDGEGVPQVAYSYRTGGLGARLLHARRQSPPFYVEKRAHPNQGVAGGDVITWTLTLYGYAPGSELVLQDRLPGELAYVDGSVTPPAVYSPTLRAVVWQGTLPAGTVQEIRYQATVSLTGTQVPPIVNSVWLTDVQTGVASWSAAVVNGTRIYLPVFTSAYSGE